MQLVDGFYRPMYGGKLCEGLELVAMMCNVQPCETSQTAFLQEQCAATDDESFGDLYYHWTYYYYDQWTGTVIQHKYKG